MKTTIDMNCWLRTQARIACRAIETLAADGNTVTDVHLSDHGPRLNVVLPPTARPLPGTTYKRLRCDIGMREQRTAYAHGCRIDWEVES
ncbi:MAG: hypothetical protein L0H23_04810 [Luteimonas sp.]|nr:hypothetical protein [Luteimonas sp.]